MADELAPLSIISFRNAGRQGTHSASLSRERILSASASFSPGIRFIMGMDPNIPPVPAKNMSPEARLDALAEVLAEGFLYLAERGLLDFDAESPASDLPVPSEEGKCMTVPERP